LDLADPFYDRLVGNGPLVALLATYNGGPAVFTFDPVPEDAVLPYIVTSGNEDEQPFDTKTESGRQVDRMVRCYTEGLGDPSLVDDIAEQARNLFHRHKLVVPGWGVFIADADGPRVAPSDPTMYGRRFTVRLTMFPA
jgi:hypothetical protein